MRTIVMCLLVLVLAACTPTGDTRNDGAAAQQLQPNVTGYTVSNADSLTDALTTAGAGAALTGGNVPAAAAISRAEAVLQCMQDAGAADARIYVETRPAGIIPETGASVVINTTRVNRNLLSCLLSGPQAQNFSAQAVQIVPCTGSGNFRYQGEEFTYLYVGVGDRLCGFFNQHFEAVKANNQG
ncbi:MAG: hypothetical protein MUE40_14130 [Anaerolineae bacterium]|nr:hypothetical protein [Anaerolineae bacterium]